MGAGWAATLPFPPSANDYWRSITVGGRSRVVLSRAAREYKAKVAARFSPASDGQPARFRGPVRVVLRAYRPRRIGDLDNLLKVSLDSLKGVAWDDDSQVVKIEAIRFDDKFDPRIEIEVYPWEGVAS